MRALHTAALGLGALALLALGAGCAAPTKLDETWGSAQRDNASRMVANPAAGEWTHETPEVLDGRTVEQTMENHRRDQTGQKPVQQAPSIINIGTTSR